MLVKSTSISIFFYRITNAGGAERMVCLLANELSRRGFLVYLVTLDKDSSTSFYLLDSSVNWLKIGLYDGFLDKFRRVIALYGIIKKYKVSVFIGFVISGDKTCFIASKLANAKLLVAERNAPDMYWIRYSSIQRWLCFLTLRFADRITIQFPGFVNKYPARLRSKIITIPNPVPRANYFAQPGIELPSGRFILLTVSRLDEKQKRVSCLIHAFALIANEFEKWDLVIVGDGPDINTIISLIKSLDLQNRVFLKSSKIDVFSEYINANLFVIPSLWEGFPNSLAEAMSHGLPAVGFFGAAGVSELITESSGWLAPTLDDSESLAATLRLGMANDFERMRRGEQAIKMMLEFDPKKQFDLWEEIIKDLVIKGVRS